MLDGEVLLPVIGEGLVEGGVFLLGDVLGVAGPDGLLLVELLEGLDLLLDLLGLLGLLLGLLVGDVLDGALLFLLLDGLDGGLLVLDLLLLGLDGQELDGVLDELRVLLDDVLELALLQVLGVLVLEVQDDVRAAADV